MCEARAHDSIRGGAPFCILSRGRRLPCPPAVGPRPILTSLFRFRSVCLVSSGHCFDGQTRLCHIRGKMRKKVWVNQGDIILIGLRDFQDSKADVILKYTSDEARRLKAQGELPDNTQINVADKIGEADDDDIPFDFEEI